MEGTAIAVIGMAGRFPGAKDVRAFWKNVAGGVESVHFFTDDELRAAGESEEALADPSYVKACARLDDIDLFDAAFWGMSPKDAAIFDPQHRFFLECAWEAFEHAGYVGEKVGGPVGVFGACGMSDYMVKNVMTHPEVMHTVGEWLVRHTGNDTNFLATRVSYELNLRGPSMNVQSACSSSLVAIHLACQSLLNGECDMALAGGSTIYAEQNRGYFYKEGEIFSIDGHTRTFDAESAGTAMASATACVVLKRLADAERDGDTIHAIVRGSAVNNDGDDKVGYLAPSVSGQARVVTEALAMAGVLAEDVSYIETHGTGTRIGDPIEIAGLTQAFRESTQKTQFCAIGSLKSNIGHAGEAAGICSFIKTVLALEHAQIPPSLHYVSPNPQCELPNSPFFVNASLTPWMAKARIAGVTGLGAGGTNCHILLEAAKASPPKTGISRQAQLLVLSAKSAASLETASKNLAGWLEENPEETLADVAYTLSQGRAAFRHRRAVVAKSATEAARALASGDAKKIVSGVLSREAPRVGFVFPGGGAQYAGMARELYDTEPVFEKTVDECLAFIQPRMKRDLRALMFPSPADAAAANAALEAPSLALPALFTIEYALTKLLASWGITPAVMMGHSAGEYAAACVAGVLSYQDALSLVATRGRLFETVPKGGMLSVQLSADRAATYLGSSLSIAAVNAPDLSVLSGPEDALTALEHELAAKEIECQRVHIDIAAHSSMLEPILEEFGAFCRTIRFDKPTLPFVSNLTGTFITDAEATDPSYWVRHLRSTVRFDEGLRALLDAGDTVLVEVGPGRTLSSLARQQPKKPTATPTLRHPKEEASDVAFLLAAVGRVWTAGADIDQASLFEGQTRRRIPLPTYAWDRQKYWLTPGQAAEMKPRSMKKRRDVSQWFYVPSWKRAPLPDALDEKAAAGPWLVVCGGSSVDLALVQALREREGTVIVARPGSRFARVADDEYTFSVDRYEDYVALVRTLRQKGCMPAGLVHLLALTPEASPLAAAVRRARDSLGIATDLLATYAEDQSRLFGSQAMFARALAPEVEALRWVTVGEGTQHVKDDGPAHPERATMLGVPKVLGRELPYVQATAVDVVVPHDRTAEHAVLVERLVREIRAARPETGSVVAYRRGDRFLETIDPMPLAPTPASAAWARDGSVTLITGGLGGIGLAVARAVARTAKSPVLVLLGRAGLPDESEWPALLASPSRDDGVARRMAAVMALRELGARVMVAAADVTSYDAIAKLAADVHARFGTVDTVVHCAGILSDTLLAMRMPKPTSPVLDTKVKGAMVLDAVFGDEAQTMVLFSSVSSLLGLAGQADYTAANAFLDAFAEARRVRGRGRTISIDWNTWQEVGMAAELVRASHGREPNGVSTHVPTLHPFLGEVASDDAAGTLFVTHLSRGKHWLVGEHVVKGGDALIPGTGFLELTRAALAHRHDHRPLQIRDLHLLSPFVVGEDEVRTLRVKVSRRDDDAEVHFTDEDEVPFATAKGGYVDTVPRLAEPIASVRARCTARREEWDGFTDQPFMAFGRRWANVRRIDYGDREALITLSLDDSFKKELSLLALHPALFDMATGGGQKTIPGFNPEMAFYVPLSYGKVTVFRGLDARITSHVRLKSAGKDVATFDVTVYGENEHPIVEVEGYTMRRIPTPTALAHRRKSELERPRRGTPMEAALREGITVDEGVDALSRVLHADPSPRVVASSVDVHAWLADLSPTSHGDARTAEAGQAFERPALSSAFVGPRTTLERDLAASWRELLGVDNVGVKDDFFELGGQSLIAVRLFAKIRRQFGVELPLSTLFEAPTIEGCAAVIAASTGVPQTQLDGTAPASVTEPSLVDAQTDAPLPRHAHVVMIQRGHAGSPFFCVHGAGGNVLNFRDLSRAMGPAQPFYGLQARGIDGRGRPHESIEAMAAAYADEVREVQPHGPYLLGGYSGGGLVALEMARRFTDEREKVGLLVFIDTFHPHMPLRGADMRARLERLRREGPSYVRGAIERMFDRRQIRRSFAEIDRLAATGSEIPPELRDMYLTRNFERAGARYSPGSWKGRALLFRAEETSPLFGDVGAAYGWDAIISEVAVERIPGDHATLLLEPNATLLIRRLGRAIAEAQREASPDATATAFAG